LPKDSIKRVLFVGGGDSMLLHETLKYPSLELVVGLELDQKVVRGCFKHFGTQPHFDDNRVEWWFGDAAKSLLMLPKDYFASFDLVLVDLSETVMSFKVTEELDVLEALSLLVKPDGIFVKNEVYFEKFKEMFPYTAQVNW
jgi:spermidine synthase